MKAKGLPGMFWGEAVSTAVFILNRSPTRSLDGKTPYEAWHGERPGVSFLHTFGCIVHVKDTKPHLKKLDDRSSPMIFVGYEAGSKAYRAYNPVDGRVHVTRDAVFDEVAQWDWGTEGGGVHNGSTEDFFVEFPDYIDVAVGGVPVGRSPASAYSPPTAMTSTTPSTPTTPTVPAGSTQVTASASPELIEFASPPSNLSDRLDVDHNDDVPTRFRKLDNLLGPSSTPGQANECWTEVS